MRNPFRIANLNALPVLVLAVLALAAAATSAQSEEVLTLDIKPQEAGSALVSLARSSGVQIMLVEQAGAEVEVEGLKGEFKLEEALATLLADTGLAYEFASENLVLVQAAEREQEPEEDEAPDEAQGDEEEEAIELTPQTVTGSRLIGGDPSAKVYSFTAEEIARFGVSNLEDFFRKLPYAFPSLTTQTANDQNAEREVISFDINGVGVSAINLRGLGTANTLVLMDGRRIAGTGGQEDDFVNLLNVPLSMIERVDIQLDGASAVYGSDAIGGVVNFITKKHSRGFSASYRHEYSSTGAHQTKATINGGLDWGRGSASAVLTRSTWEPIVNEKTGWTSLDFRPYLGPEFDQRITWTGQPGVVCTMEKSVYSGFPPFYDCDSFTFYQLPADHSGVGATIDDFHPFDPFFENSAVPLDEIDPHNGAELTTDSLSLNLEQYITEDLRAFANVFYSWNESFQDYSRIIPEMLVVPASNAYNPFGQHVLVSYAPIYESDNGLMPAQFDESENESRTIAAGLIWTFGNGQELEVSANRTKSWRTAFRFLADARRTILDPTAEAFYEALSSPDPNRAINLFGNGTAQGTSLEEFLTQTDGPYTGINETRQYTMSARGHLFSLWGGPITYSLGGEFRENIILSQEGEGTYAITDLNNVPIDRLLGSRYSTGVARPSRDAQAYFAELALPLFGEKNARPGLHALIVTLQARYDVHESVAARGGLMEDRIPARWHYWDPDEGFAYIETTTRKRTLDSSNLASTRKGDLSPRIGFRYDPAENFSFRAAWRRSFKVANWSDEFSPLSRQQQPNYGSFRNNIIIDPYDPDGPTMISPAQGVLRYRLNFADVEPEYSDSWSAALEWSPEAIPGLRWTVHWSKVDFTNRIRRSGEWLTSQPELVLNHPDVVERSERGDLLVVYDRYINLAEEYNEFITTELAYSINTRFGTFYPRVSYARFLEDFHRVSEATPRTSAVGTQNGNDEYKWRGSVSWQWRRLSADVHVHYSPSYVNDSILFCAPWIVDIPGSRCTPDLLWENYLMPVSSLTTVDLTVTYRLDNGLQLRAGGTNILDRAAPRTISAYDQPYDPTRWDARGRVFFLELTWEM